MKIIYTILLGFIVVAALKTFTDFAYAQTSTSTTDTAPAPDVASAPTSTPIRIPASTANASSGGALVGFRAAERLSNPQAWQTNSADKIRFCYVITELTNEEGESFYLEQFQLKCTAWQ